MDRSNICCLTKCPVQVQKSYQCVYDLKMTIFITSRRPVHALIVANTS